MREAQERAVGDTAAKKSRRKSHEEKRERRNIQFAHGLSSDEMILLLQHELLRARTQGPLAEVSIPNAIVHDIKFRLSYYAKLFGEVDREKDLFDDEQESDQE